MTNKADFDFKTSPELLPLEAYKTLVKSVIKKYPSLNNNEESFEEAISIGLESIARCLKTFNKDGEGKFTTYAYRAIENGFNKKFKEEKLKRIIPKDLITYIDKDEYMIQSIVDKNINIQEDVISKNNPSITIRAYNKTISEARNNFGVKVRSHSNKGDYTSAVILHIEKDMKISRACKLLNLNERSTYKFISAFKKRFKENYYLIKKQDKILINKTKIYSPYSIIKKELADTSLTIKEASDIMGMSTKMVTDVLREERVITENFATRFEKLTGYHKDDLLNAYRSYYIYKSMNDNDKAFVKIII